MTALAHTHSCLSGFVLNIQVRAKYGANNIFRRIEEKVSGWREDEGEEEGKLSQWRLRRAGLWPPSAGTIIGGIGVVGAATGAVWFATQNKEALKQKWSSLFQGSLD